jgi:3,4-dihydroxy-2-butanone 4-phosphate synthase
MSASNVERAVADLAAGRMVVVVDDVDREDEGDLVLVADRVTPEAINFMAREGRGLICVAMTGERLDALALPMMVPPDQNTGLHRTAFTVSVDAVDGTTTGISAFDRARTVQLLVSPDASPGDFARPGHVFPLRAHPDGVLGRRGQTEAGVDLARLAGCRPAAVICEIMAADGTMARGPALQTFARWHDLTVVSVAELAAYRRSGPGQPAGCQQMGES